MVQFNELRITPDGKYIVIDAEIQNLDYYDDVYLKSIQMNVYSKPEDFTTPMPDSHSILIWNTDGTPIKRIRKFVDIDTIEDKLFFIYAMAEGEPSEETPCGAKDPLLVGVVYNKAILYKNSINALSTLNDCEPSKELIDYILNVKAFQLAIETGDYRTAIQYWNNTFKNSITIYKTNCGCHGH